MTYTIEKVRCVLVSDGQTEAARDTASTSDEAAEIFYLRLSGLPHEEVHAIYLNGRNKVIGVEMIARGGMHGCALTPRDVVRGAIVANASAFIIAHNHPSGDPTPSRDDLIMTKALLRACEAVGLPLLDHLVVCPEERTYRSAMGQS